MSQSLAYIQRLQALKEGERSLLRCHAGQPLYASIEGFDVFTGLWWPLRDNNQAAPRRETSWLVAKLYGGHPIPHFPPDRKTDSQTLARILGRCERGARAPRHFRSRFDGLLCSPLPSLEPHLHWALSVVSRAVKQHHAPGLDWVALLDDLSAWDRGSELRGIRSVHELWAEQYLKETSRQRKEEADVD